MLREEAIETGPLLDNSSDAGKMPEEILDMLGVTEDRARPPVRKREQVENMKRR